MKKTFFVLIAYCLLPTAYCFCQDLHFSQFSETPILLNPAATGMFDGFYRAGINYKSQWHSMGNPYRSMMAAYDLPLPNRKKKMTHFGAGAYFYSDKAGDSKLGTSSGNLTSSAIVTLDENNSLSAGFQLGLVQKSASIANLQWPSQYNGQTFDPTISANEPNSFNNFSFFDLGSGIHYLFRKDADKDLFRISGGVSYFHITQPAQKFYSAMQNKLYGKMAVNGLLRYDFPKTKFGIVASALYSSQGPANEINFGGLVRYKVTEGTKFTGFLTESAISGGVLYRVHDAVIPQLVFELSNFSIGVSYDVNISSLKQATRKAGGLEISLRYCNLKDALFKGGK